MTLKQFAQRKISLSAYAFGVLVIVLLTQLSQILPGQFYFTFAGFLGIVPETTPTHWSALAIKLTIPAATGVLLGRIWGGDGLDAAGPAGISGALLMAWPAVILWDFVVPTYAHHRRNAFLIFYALYLASFCSLCRAGARSGLQLHGTRSPVAEWGSIGREIATGVGAAIATTAANWVMFADD